MIEISLRTWPKWRQLQWIRSLSEPDQILIDGRRVTQPTRIVDKAGNLLCIDWAGTDRWWEHFHARPYLPLAEPYGRDEAHVSIFGPGQEEVLGWPTRPNLSDSAVSPTNGPRRFFSELRLDREDVMDDKPGIVLRGFLED